MCSPRSRTLSKKRIGNVGVADVSYYIQGGYTRKSHYTPGGAKHNIL